MFFTPITIFIPKKFIANRTICQYYVTATPYLHQTKAPAGTAGARILYYVNYIVTKINLHTKSAAITVTTISFLVYLPVKIAISTYAIAPTPIPFEIE